MAASTPKKIFISHRAADMERAKSLAAVLLAAGFDAWLDAWEVLPGDNFVNAMQKGISEADGCLVLLSNSGVGTGWMNEEVCAVLAKKVQDRDKPSEPFVVIPVLLDPGLSLPVFLNSRSPRQVADLQGIINGLRRKSDKPPIGPSPLPLVATRCIVLDLNLTADTLTTTLRCDNDAGAPLPPLPASSTLPAATLARLSTTLKPTGTLRHADGTSIREQTLREIGVELGKVIFPDPLAAAFCQVLHDRDTDEKHMTRIEVLIQADTPALFGLPFEAMVVPDPSAAFALPLAMIPRLSVSRVVTSGPAIRLSAAPGPLRILVVAVSAGDTGLDFDKELGVVLDAVDNVRGQSIVDFIDDELPTLEAIQKALEREAFHVVHISAHGEAGALVFQGDKGPAKASPAELTKALKRNGQAPPLVVLSACDSGRSGVEVDRRQVALALCETGVPRVVAMSHPVSDRYATDLAGKLYRHLAQGDLPLPAAALAEARRDCEAERAEKGKVAGGEVGESELATPVLYARKEAQDVALFDRSLPFDTTRAPARPIGVPGFTRRPLGYFVGRRRLRAQLIAAMEGDGAKGAMVLGMGGAGKSCLVASLLERQVRHGWLPVVVVGKTSLGGVAQAIGKQVLLNAAKAEDLGDDVKALAKVLAQENGTLTDDDRIGISINLLATTKIALVLDNFEDNQVGLDQATGVEGRPTIDRSLAEYLQLLTENARAGAVLLTSRYPVPELDALDHIEVTMLEQQEVRKLLWRLPSFAERNPAEVAEIAEYIGGHPRALEFADALIRNDKKRRFPDLLSRVRRNATGLDLEGLTAASMAAVADATGRIAAADIFLDDLLELATRDEGLVPLLAAVAVFELPVPTQAVEVAAQGIDLAKSLGGVAGALERLAALSLVTPAREEWRTEWVVHRWTAHEIWKREARNPEVDAVVAAWWEAQGNRPQALEHWLAAGRLRRACEVGAHMILTYQQLGRIQDALALCLQMENLARGSEPYWQANAARFAGDQYVALGNTQEAFVLFTRSLEISKRLAEAEPNHPDFQRILSVSHERLGNVQVGFGNTQEAFVQFTRSLEIAKRLAEAEPSNADFQRDMALSYERLGDVQVSLGNTHEALVLFTTSLEARKRLAEARQSSADFQRDLAIGYERLGDVAHSLGDIHAALGHYELRREILKRLVEAEPSRADLQRDLAVSYNKLGDIQMSLGDMHEALRWFALDLEIAKRLVEGEPSRADLQRDLAISYERLGDVAQSLGDIQAARCHYELRLSIIQRLAEAEPCRTDLQRDLSVSYDKVGKVQVGLGNAHEAAVLFTQSLRIARRLAEAEPSRADYQRDLAVSLERLGDVAFSSGELQAANRYYESRLEIFQRLAEAEPTRADFRRELSVSYNKLGKVQLGLGNMREAEVLFTRSLWVARPLAEREPSRADFQRDLSVSYEKLGDVQLGLGAVQEAQVLFARSLEIRRRLVEAESSRADLLSDLATSFWRMSTVMPDADVWLRKARAIFRSLYDRGALHAMYVPFLQQLDSKFGGSNERG